MRINLVIRIGKSGQGRWARKTIELEFAPVAGMQYADVTWHERRKIIDVCITHDGETAVLDVALEPDESDSQLELRRIYEGHGWNVD